MLQFFLNSCFSDTVFVTLLHTAVETAISEAHKLLCTGGVPTSLTLLFWWWLMVSSVFMGQSTWTSCSSLPAELFLNSYFSDTVFVTLLHTAVETAISEAHKLLCTGGVPTSLTLLFWWWLMVSSVFMGQSTWTSCSSLPAELFLNSCFSDTALPPPPHPTPPLVPSKPYGFLWL